MKRYFILGTDTDCGKTYVTRKLVDYIPHAVAIKPVASGGSMIEDQFISYDAQHLAQNELLPSVINPWCFQLPVSPHIAAKQAGLSLSVKEIAEYCLSFTPKNVETLFIEGAGGLMVPLNDTETWVDFLILSQIPVILVVGMRLGCINHALLTINALKVHNINCAGWIANCLDENMLYLSDNISTLERLIKVPLIAKISYQGELTTVKF